eukprot:GEMP01027739.1.p1 GENE.GEMP01027739.1~~GEMP01027739.1.p1  ORF type:complete len:452 (+),score=66.49 GEMP01027739.1:172-1527(+)
MNWDEAADWGERGPGQRSPPSDAPISNSYHHSSASTGALQPPSASSRHQRQPRQHHQLGSLIAGPSTGASGSGAPLPIGYNMSSPSVPNMSPNSSRGGHSPLGDMNHGGLTGGCADRSVSSRDNVFDLEPDNSFINNVIPPAMDQKAIPPQPASSSRIRAVWAGNLEEEIAKIQDLLEVYSFVAVEVRSPGILARPTLPVDSYLEYNYLALKCNVDMSKVTQIELTFADSTGNLPKPVTTWQFNFSFNPYKDMYSQETITELRNCGVMMDWLQEQGIDPEIFGEVLTSSGLVLNDQIQWVSVIGCTQSFDRKTEFEAICKNSADIGPFNGAFMSHLNPLLAYSGIYDFAFLLNLLTGKPLPETVEGFCEEMQLYFPKVCLRRPHSSEEALTLPTQNSANGSSRRHPHRRIHCLRNVHDPSLFAFRALNEWFSCPDKQGWGLLKRSAALPGA